MAILIWEPIINEVYAAADPIDPQNSLFRIYKQLHADEWHAESFVTPFHSKHGSEAKAKAECERLYEAWLNRVALPRLIAMGVLPSIGTNQPPNQAKSHEQEIQTPVEA